MNIRRAVPCLVFAFMATAALADVDWMILPKYSGSGRMLIQGTRDALPRNGKPTKLIAKLSFNTPQSDRFAKYKYLRIGSMCGMNEKGLAVIWTGGDPTSDRGPEGSDIRKPHVSMLGTLRSCATAQQAVTQLRGAFDRKLIYGSAIFFIADPIHAFVVECSPRHFASWELPHAFCVYSNCWKLPGMYDGSLNTAERATFNFQREWAAREVLRQAFDEKQTISVADSLRASRVNIAEANGETFAKNRGKAELTSAPANKFSADSYLFELDSEFPDTLSCVYAAIGPQRHTVYLPIPLGAADRLPPELADKAWAENAHRLAGGALPSDPMRPELVEFERKQLAEFSKVRREASVLLHRDKCEEARQLLRDTLAKQAKATLEFLSGLK